MTRAEQDRERIAHLLRFGRTEQQTADLLGLPLQYVRRLARDIPIPKPPPLYPSGELARGLMAERNGGKPPRTRVGYNTEARAPDSPIRQAVDLVERGYSTHHAALLTDTDETELQRWFA
jgi:hypothetical protein